MDSTTYNHETGGCAAKFHVDGGGLSTPHPNFGGGGYPAPTQWVCRLGGPGAARE
jgi:hypothetical protein